jgi:hypothetical protein
MKTSKIYFALGLLGLALQATAGEYCLAFRRELPYTGTVEYKGKCDGQQFRALTGWFGNTQDGLDRFSALLESKGFKLLNSFSNQTIVVFSKNAAVAAPACLVEARYLGSCAYDIDCSGEEGDSIEVPFTKKALNSFLNAYQYKTIQTWAKVDSFRDHTQCKGLDRYLLLEKK